MKPILCTALLGVALLGSLPVSGQIVTEVENRPTSTTCTGSEFTFVFTANDTRSNDNKYNVYIYRSSYEPGSGGVDFGQAIQVASNVGAFSAAAGGGRNRRTATVQFDPEALSSGEYKIWIFAQTSDARANRSLPFTLSAAPTLTITGLATSPLYGQAARIRFTFSGNGGYTFAHRTNLVDDILPFRSNPPNPFDFDFSLGTTSSYYYDKVDVVQFKGTCGSGKSIGIVSGGTLISAQSLSITFGSISQPSTCPGTSITVPFSVNGVPPSGTKYRLEFSDSNGSFSNPRTVATVTGTGSPLAGNTPTDYAPGTGYKLRIVPDNFNINTSIAVNVTLTRPAPPDAQTSYAYCPGENPTQLTASGENLRWYNDSGQLPGAPTPPKDVASSYNVTQTKDGCQSNVTTIRTSIKPKSDRPNPGNRDYCQNEQANTLSELTGGAANPKWFDSNDTELSGNFRPNTGEVGTKTYRVSQQYNDCRSDKAEFNIRVKLRPGAPGVKNAEPVCQLTSVSNALLRAAVTSGDNLRWYETEQGGAGSDQLPTPRTGNAGLQNYFVSQSNEGCEGPRAKIEQEVKPAPVLPTVTPNPVLRCVNEAVTTLMASGNGLRWYRQANGGNSEGSISIATDQVRTDTYYVTQTGTNGCESTRQAVEVRVNPKSDPPGVSNREYCRNDPAKPLSESASAATKPMWFDDGTGAEISGDFKPNTGEVGTKTYRVSQEYNGCRSDVAKFNIRVKPIPSSPTTQKTPDICQLLQRPNTEIVAAVKDGTSLRWYETEQGGAGTATAPSPRTTSAGLQTYFVSQTVEGCESTRAKVEQTVLPAPVLPTLASNPVLRCVNEAVTTLTASGNGLRWYRQASGGNSEGSIAIATDQVRTDTYYVTQTGSNGCESGRQAVEVRVLARPSAPEVTATSFVCQFTRPLPLRATGSGVLVWSGSGITGSTETTPVPATDAPATFSYQVVQRVGGCVSPMASLTYTIRPAPAAPGVQSPLNLCRNAPARDLSANGERLKWYQTADRSDPPQNRVNFNPVTAGTTRYYVSQSDNFTCESQNSLLDVRVLLQAAARLTGDSLVLPSDSSAIRVRLTGDPPFMMTLWNGRTVTTSANPYVVWVKTQVDASYQLRALSNDCGPGDPGTAYLLRVQKPLGTEPGPPGGEVSLRTYPNPTTESANLAWQAPARAVVQLRLSDVGGRTVWQSERTGTGAVETETLPLRGLPAGLYLIQLLDGQKSVATRRILKN